MRESGYYPPGAEFDPSAPYNDEGIECSVCNGTGEDEDYSECTNCNGTGWVK